MLHLTKLYYNINITTSHFLIENMHHPLACTWRRDMIPRPLIESWKMQMDELMGFAGYLIVITKLVLPKEWSYVDLVHFLCDCNTCASTCIKLYVKIKNHCPSVRCRCQLKSFIFIEESVLILLVACSFLSTLIV